MDEKKKLVKRKTGERTRLFARKGKKETFSWKKFKKEGAAERENNLLEQAEAFKAEEEAKQTVKKDDVKNGGPYSISIAIPGAFLNNAQSAELRAYMAGQVARAATLFCVDEIVIYDETCNMTKESIDSYWSGSWYGDVMPNDGNYESCFFLAKILEYLECPQYLRKRLFTFQRSLKHAGLLNPLDSQHHLRSDDFSIPYREGVVLDLPIKKGRGPMVDIGLGRDLQLEDDVVLPPGTRVTVEISNLHDKESRFRGKLTSSKKVREATGLYWGYTVRLASSMMEVINREKYDVIIGTSPNGKSAADTHICVLNKPKVLLVFGGVRGVETAFEGEEALVYKSPKEAFDHIVNSLPNKGSWSERVEENILVTLSEISMRMQQSI